MDITPRLKVENANFEKVCYFVEKVLSESAHYCGCQRCKMDAIALALNTLPPHYYVDSGHMNHAEAGSPWILIEIAVKEALGRVMLNPHHAVPSQEEDSAVPQDYA